MNGIEDCLMSMQLNISRIKFYLRKNINLQIIPSCLIAFPRNQLERTRKTMRKMQVNHFTFVAKLKVISL